MITPVGKRIMKIMEAFGLGQAALAEKIGATQASLSMYAGGHRNMPQSTAMAFQAALGVRWQWLLNGEGEMLLSKADHLPDDLKELADLWPRLSEGDRQYVLGLAEGRVAKGKK